MLLLIVPIYCLNECYKRGNQRSDLWAHFQFASHTIVFMGIGIIRTARRSTMQQALISFPAKPPKLLFFFWFSFLTSREKVLVRKKNKFRLELVKLVLFNVQCSPCLMLASFLQFLHSLQHTVLIMQTPMKVSN